MDKIDGRLGGDEGTGTHWDTLSFLLAALWRYQWCLRHAGITNVVTSAFLVS
jgi:hypothetical protein